MSKKMNSIFASAWRGIKKAARWVARMFGYKADTKFGRILWYVFATCACVFVLYAAIETVWGYVDIVQSKREARLQQQPEYCHDYWNTQLSSDIIYHDAYDAGYVYNNRIGRRTLTGISWIRESEDGDDLVCYSNGDKRGYFDRNTGELAIPPQYEKAWVFSEGLACVMLDGKLGFIDHEGNMVIDNAFEWSPYIGNYCFHNGLCLMGGHNCGIGLIDEQGNWAVEPEYEFIDRLSNGCWKTRDSVRRYGLLDPNGKTLLPCEYAEIEMDYENGCIRAITQGHVDQVFDFDGNLLNPCDFKAIEEIGHFFDGNDEVGDEMGFTPNCLMFKSYDCHYGLMDRKGNIITPPSFSSIRAIAPDRFFCKGPYGAVVLDDKGNEVGEKL